MADVTTTSRQIKVVAAFADGDTRTIAFDTARTAFAKSDIDAFATASAPVLVGDKTGAKFTRFQSAQLVEQTTTQLDLTSGG